MPSRGLRRMTVMIAATAPCAAAFAQQALMPVSEATLPAVQVNASRMELPPIDVPAALSVVRVAPSESGEAGVNLAEALVGVPGILARDRQNYAQDEQISIRGFGSRSSFGVRSIRLYLDGMPATLPDGQGQVSHFMLDTADRVEVLRGPFSVLYGNAAGGVVQLWSAPGTSSPQTTLGLYGGSDDSFRYSADTRGIAGATVAADTARIGDSRSMWQMGRVSVINEVARTAHAAVGMSVPEFVETILAHAARETKK